MIERMDVCTPRKGKDGKTRWLKIGAAFPAKQGNGWNIILDALPLPDAEGRCAISLFEPREREDRPAFDNTQAGGAGAYRSASRGAPADLDDSIPF